MELLTRTWTGKALGTVVKLLIVADDAKAGDEALRRAAEDLEETEHALSRFRPDSELGVLNQEGTLLAGPRLLTAIKGSIRAHEWSDGLLDPRVIDALEAFGYRSSLPKVNVGAKSPQGPLGSADMWGWIDEAEGRIALPPGVRLDLAGVGKALGIGWAAARLVGHAGLLVDVGGDVVALGHDECGEPWRVAVGHGAIVGEFAGSALAVATSTTRLRSWTAGGREAHHIIDPRTGAPSQGDLLYATVAAPSILEADLAAKLLIIQGKKAAEHLDPSCRIVVTDRHGQTEVLETQTRGSGTGIGQ
jgi:thiamine biosynthesis lipoprotein